MKRLGKWCRRSISLPFEVHDDEKAMEKYKMKKPPSSNERAFPKREREREKVGAELFTTDSSFDIHIWRVKGFIKNSFTGFPARDTGEKFFYRKKDHRRKGSAGRKSTRSTTELDRHTDSDSSEHLNGAKTSPPESKNTFFPEGMGDVSHRNEERNLQLKNHTKYKLIVKVSLWTAAQLDEMADRLAHPNFKNIQTTATGTKISPRGLRTKSKKKERKRRARGSDEKIN
ncbi:hypothetical protein RUM44_006582 [Polyplax serrata]|uniref:Uncharacterized protein n=1 Tax=Polyplax serrata TaxID=468196 RepID=A0ABR1AK91_POLSC